MAGSSQSDLSDTFTKTHLTTAVSIALAMHGVDCHHANKRLEGILRQADYQRSLEAAQNAWVTGAQQIENREEDKSVQLEAKDYDMDNTVGSEGAWVEPHSLCGIHGTAGCWSGCEDEPSVEPTIKQGQTSKEEIMDLLEHVLSTRFGITPQLGQKDGNHTDHKTANEVAQQETRDATKNCCSDQNSADDCAEVNEDVTTCDSTSNNECVDDCDDEAVEADNTETPDFTCRLDELEWDIQELHSSINDHINDKRKMAVELWDLRAKVKGLKHAFELIGIDTCDNQATHAHIDKSKEACSEWGHCAETCKGLCHGVGDCDCHCPTSDESTSHWYA